MKIAIVGFGRFGQLLAHMLRPAFDIAIVEADPERQAQATQQGLSVIPSILLKQADVIFLAVPISALEDALKALGPLVHKDQTVMDVCSVKVYPAKLMKKYLKDCQTIASHPLFGPDSASDGLQGLQLALCPLKAQPETVRFWRKFWEEQGLKVYETTPEAHDHDMVYSLAFTQTIARLVQRMEVPELKLTTTSTEAIQRVSDLALKDTDQLYHDMLRYNPYFPELKAALTKATKLTLQQLDTIQKEIKSQKKTKESLFKLYAA